MLKSLEKKKNFLWLIQFWDRYFNLITYIMGSFFEAPHNFEISITTFFLHFAFCIKKKQKSQWKTTENT